MSRKVAIVGAGYVGVPLAQVFAEAGNDVLLVDVSPERVARINNGDSYIEDVPSPILGSLVESGHLKATTDYDALREVEAILIALPTPLSKQREPDLTIVMSAIEQIATRLQPGQMVVLESTTYPGTTRDLLRPALEEGSGLVEGKDFFLAFSPERVDPGREDWTTKTTPKVVGGLEEASTKKVADLYRSSIDTIIEVSSPESAEMTKLLENVFRSVNIALANELAQLCDRMGLDVWEIIDAAATKPFGFMRFSPGPGVGGHCLPIDPSFLSWRVKRRVGSSFRFVELANDVNENMPDYVLRRLMLALNRKSRAIRGCRVLLLGLAYKPNTSDARESPSLVLADHLLALGAEVRAADPHVKEGQLDARIRLVDLCEEEVAAADAVVLLTDHDAFDYAVVVANASYVLDTRGRLSGDQVERL